MECKPINCSIYASHKLEPNPDISGIGVVIGFVASGWATFLFLMLRFVIAPSRSNSSPSDLLDDTLRNGVWRVLGAWKPPRRWIPAIDTLVLTMSDQQLVTGLSIIISGYSRLSCDISFYHWQMITLLAWFSSATHLATLLFLRQYLQRNRWVWYVRVFLMTALAIMLAVAIAPTSNVPVKIAPIEVSGLMTLGQHEISGMPAWCAFNFTDRDMILGLNMAPMIYSEIILLGSLSIRLVEMSTTIRRLSGGSLKAALGRLPRMFLGQLCEKLQKSHKTTQALLMPLVVFPLVLLISMQNVLDFLTSDACGVLWLLFSLTWGTVRLSLERRGGDENAWGFGQLVPVLLLLLPALLMLEGFSGTRPRAKDSSLLADSINYNTSTSPNMESQEGMQLMPTRAAEGDMAAVSYNTTLDSTRPIERPGNGLYACVQYLCNHDFRDELWYLENLYLILFYVTGAACAVFGTTILESKTRFNESEDLMSFSVPIFVGAGVCSVSVIPLCGIVNSILRSGGRPPFPIKLAIDSGKKYRVCRWIFYFYAPITGILFSALNPLRYPAVALAPLLVWYAVCLVVSSYAFCTGLFSIYSQILLSDRPRGYTRCDN